jgi:hypothetical protein
MATTTTAKTLVEHKGRVDSFGRDLAQIEEYKQIAKALDDEARENWDNPAWHRQVAQDMATYLDYGFTFENMFSTYFQTETVGEFDRVRLVERRGLKVYYTARGGYIDETQLRTEQWEIPRDTLGFHVSEFEDKLRAGFATSIAEIVSLAEARLEAEVNRRIFSLLQSAVPSGSPYYGSAASLVKATLDGNISAVKDAIKARHLSRSSAGPPWSTRSATSPGSRTRLWRRSASRAASARTVAATSSP